MVAREEKGRVCVCGCVCMCVGKEEGGACRGSTERGLQEALCVCMCVCVWSRRMVWSSAGLPPFLLAAAASIVVIYSLCVCVYEGGW